MVRPVTATRERILAAAYTRFSGYGFRRTSMEDIATEAGVSRASLYTQFQNKEEIFRGLARQLHDRSMAGLEAALELDAPLAERLQAAVEGKTLRFIEIAYGSPHGSELLDENSRLCGDMVTGNESQFRDVLARMFRDADRAGDIDLSACAMTAADAGDLLARSISGLKGPGLTVASYRKRIVALCQLFVAGLAGGKKAPRRPAARVTRKPAARRKGAKR